MDSPNERESERIPVKVIDRRFWAREGDEGEETGPQKPAYVEQLETRIRDLEQKAQDTAARYRQALGELEATAARLRRDAGQEADRRVRAVLIDLLEVIDNLDRAVAAASEVGDKSPLYEGVSMARDLFLQKLRSVGVQRLPSLHQPFDPSRHEALTTLAASEPALDGTILGVIEEGYLMGDEVLRAARVAVGRYRA